MKYQDLVESVRDQAGLDSGDQAGNAVSAVLTTLARSLAPHARRRVAEDLPGSLDPAVEVSGEQEARDGTSMLAEIAQRLDTTPERARYISQAVLDGLRAGAPELVDFLHGQLRSDVLDVLAEAGEPPRRAASARPEVPTELSEAEVEQALRQLPDWVRDDSGISRTVQLPQDRMDPLLSRVQRAARNFNDHARVERDGDAITFTLHTGRPPVITRPDLELAEQIDRAVAEVGSGGRPGP